MPFHCFRIQAAAPWRTFAAACLIAVFAAACGGSTPTPDLGAQATISALATSNAQLATQVAALVAAAAPAATPTPAPAAQAAEAAPPAVESPLLAESPASEPPASEPPASEPPASEPPAVEALPATEVSPAAAPATAGGDLAAAAPAAPAVAELGAGALPQLLAAIPLAAAGETLYDLRLDRAANRIFVTDSADQLHVLDATTYAPLAVLPYGGWLELDSEHNRLYVYKPYVTQDESLIHVIDTQTLEEAGAVAGRALAIDAAHDRLFVGEPYTVSTADSAEGVRVLDGGTLEQTGVFTQPGAPLYNPAADQLLIAAYTVYTADPQTQEVTGDLFPELMDMGETGMLWCNGCSWVDDIQYFPADQVIAVTVSAHCAGKGCGEEEPPRFFAADTMTPIDPAVAPQVQADCGSGASLVNVVDGRRYVNTLFDRYVVYTNLLVTDAVGTPLAQRDGLRIDYVNARTGQGYLYDGTVLDLASLEPIGRWPASCLLAEDSESGLLFGHRNGSLYVIAETGGEPAASPGPAPDPLPSEWPIRQIAVSPNYAIDNTLLAVSGGGIWRSTDSGEQWRRLRGGLPEEQGSNWVVAFSPAYAGDRTIFAGGDRNEYWGEGVWRSTDGGDRWQAQWDGLEHRRIQRFYLAPDFAANQTLVAQAEFYDVATGESGESYQQSTDGGLSWTLAATGSLASGAGAALPPISELLPGYVAPPALPVRTNDLRNALQVTLNGSEWITAPLTLPEQEWFYALLPGPRYPDDPALYAFGHLSLWRSTDNGATWAAWEDDWLDGLDYTNQMSTAAVSPVAADRGYRLFVGTANGEVWMLDPAEMAWSEPIAASPAVAAAAVPATATAAPATPAPAASLPTPTPAAAPAATAALTGTATVTGTGAVTATGAVTGTATVTAAAGTASAPAATPTPVVTAEPLAGDPPAGLFRPEGSLGIVWEANGRIQQDIGWARQQTPAAIAGAVQHFEHGVMIWRADTSQIYVFLADTGEWQSFADTFEEGDVESDPRLAPPGGLLQPIRGFGKIWRDNPALRDQLGWATAKEQAQSAEVHSFERGQMLRYGGLLFVVIGVDTDRGRWY